MLKKLTFCFAILQLWGCSLLPPSKPKVDIGLQNIKTIDVYLLGGQSNADGHGRASELPQEVVEACRNVLFFHGNGGALSPLPSYTWLPLQPGSGSKKRNSGFFGPEIGFGYQLQQWRADKPNHKIAIIKYAVGGSNLHSQWQAGGDNSRQGDGPFYRNFQDTVLVALNVLQHSHPEAQVNIKAMLWHQGEADTIMKRAIHYQANLATLVEDVRATFGQEVNFLIGQLSEKQYVQVHSGFPLVVQAQAQLAAASNKNGLVPTKDLPVDLPNNRIHFGAQGQLLLGKRYAEVLGRLVNEPR